MEEMQLLDTSSIFSKHRVCRPTQNNSKHVMENNYRQPSLGNFLQRESEENLKNLARQH